MSREDQYNVTVEVGGENLGTWDKLSGGEIDSEEAKYRPGGMAAQVSLGGYRNVGNLTVSRLYDLTRDHSRMAFLLNRVGKADVTIVKQSLDVDGNAFGKALVYTGKLKAVTPPDHDSESSDPAMLEIEISSANVTVQQ